MNNKSESVGTSQEEERLSCWFYRNITLTGAGRLPTGGVLVWLVGESSISFLMSVGVIPCCRLLIMLKNSVEWG